MTAINIDVRNYVLQNKREHGISGENVGFDDLLIPLMKKKGRCD